MKLALSPLLFLVVSAAGLILAEFRRQHAVIYILKPLSTLCVLLVLVLSFYEVPHNSVYSIGILIGLCFSLAGDVILMFSSENAFRVGLLSFLLAHVAYAITFTLLAGVRPINFLILTDSVVTDGSLP